jgi:hypothetical protein
MGDIRHRGARGSVAAGGDDPAMARARVAKRREGNEIEFSRIVAFSDGVFAIAITLLVLPLGIEAGLANGEVADALWDQRENLLAFAISFAVIGLLMAVDARRAGLTSMDEAAHRESRIRSIYIASVFLLSIPVAFVAPSVAPYMWLVLFLDPTSRIVARAST